MAVIGGAGGGIKSIQRGSTACGATGTTTTATINQVDLAKSFISVSCANGHDTEYYASITYVGWATSLMVGATLSSNVQLSFTTGSHYASSNLQAGNPTIYWEVIEYE